MKIAMPDCPEPTSFGLTKGFHIRAGDIAHNIIKSLNINNHTGITAIPEPELHDIPEIGSTDLSNNDKKQNHTGNWCQ